MGVASTIYRVFMRRNYTYVPFVLAGAWAVDMVICCQLLLIFAYYC